MLKIKGTITSMRYRFMWSNINNLEFKDHIFVSYSPGNCQKPFQVYSHQNAASHPMVHHPPQPLLLREGSG